MSSYQLPTFSAQPNVNLRPLYTFVFGPWTCTLSVTFPPAVGGIWDNAYDQDMYYAFHTVGEMIVTSYKLKIKEINGVKHVVGRRAEGYFYDLYDFAYGTEVLPTHGARVQAGYPTLGTAGRVYQVDRVNFDGRVNMLINE